MRGQTHTRRRRLLLSGGGARLQSISRSGVPLSTAIYTPRLRFPSTVAAGDSISVDAGLEYSLDGGTWTSDSGTRGTARKIQFRLTSSSEYETEVALDATIDSVDYTISVTTIADPTSYWVDENGDYLTDENGDRITI